MNGETDTRINKGVCREAFEVHLENMHNELQLTPTQFKNCDMPSEGRRWILYRRASGSDPYFTGPDTNLSQVKSENASLISNIDTILNIAKFIIEQGEALSVEELKNIVKTKNKEEIRSFSKQFWETTSQEVQNQIIKELEGSVVNRKYTVLIR